MTIEGQAILNARILVVDDKQLNVELLEQVLREQGFANVDTTTDPRTVCDLHREHDYDLILLDLQMPRMDGFAVMEALKRQARGSWLPVLVVTADPGHTHRALEAGARDFVAKPFDVVELKARIRNMVELRLLYRRLESQNASLEQAVLERTAQLRDSEERYRSLTELACDWYWEQDENGKFTKMFGPVLEMLGLWSDSLAAGEDAGRLTGWDEGERSLLRAAIAAREPFLDFVFSRTKEDGTVQKYQVSGEPMFGPACRFLGYRGIGQEIVARPQARIPPDLRLAAAHKE